MRYGAQFGDVARQNRTFDDFVLTLDRRTAAQIALGHPRPANAGDFWVARLAAEKIQRVNNPQTRTNRNPRRSLRLRNSLQSGGSEL